MASSASGLGLLAAVTSGPMSAAVNGQMSSNGDNSAANALSNLTGSNLAASALSSAALVTENVSQFGRKNFSFLGGCLNMNCQMLFLGPKLLSEMHF